MTQLPDLFGVAQLNISSLFNKLGVSLQEVNSPAGVFLQIIKLILNQKTTQISDFIPVYARSHQFIPVHVRLYLVIPASVSVR